MGVRMRAMVNVRLNVRVRGSHHTGSQALLKVAYLGCRAAPLLPLLVLQPGLTLLDPEHLQVARWGVAMCPMYDLSSSSSSRLQNSRS